MTILPDEVSRFMSTGLGGLVIYCSVTLMIRFLRDAFLSGFSCQYKNAIRLRTISIIKNLFFLKKFSLKLNFHDICYMNVQWHGLLSYLKFLIKRNPE